MTQVSLSTVTLKTVANYRSAAEQAVGAYRSGGHRLIAAAQHGVDLAAKRGAEPYVPGLAVALRSAGDNVGSYAVKGVDAVSAGTERAIVMSANGLSTQVKRIAKLADSVDNRVVARSLQAAARISLPGAKVALTLSERVSAGADKLAQVAAGPRKAKANAATQAKTAAAQHGAKVKAAPKRAVAVKPASRIVTKAVRDTAAEIEVTGQAVKKAAKRRARALVSQVGQAVKPAAKLAKPAKPKAAANLKAAAKPKAAVKPKAAAKPKAARRAARQAAPAVRAVQDVAAAA